MLDPVVLFFILGAVATLLKSGLRIPEPFYNVLSIYLLLSIGIKGGIELYKVSWSNFGMPALGTLALGVTICIVAYYLLRLLGRYGKPDAIALATHYGSVSAVTFAVVTSFLQSRHTAYEEYVTVLLVLLEIPALATGVLMAQLMRNREAGSRQPLSKILGEVFFGKSVLLLLGGLFIGWFTAHSGNTQLNAFFFDNFKGFLALFMLEMGIVTAQRLGGLRQAGPFLIIFAIGMPIISASIGMGMAWLTGLSAGGAIVLATMAASASYIAAPATVRMALPEANPTWYMTAALGITFPFNVIFGIPLYTRMVEMVWG